MNTLTVKEIGTNKEIIFDTQVLASLQGNKLTTKTIGVRKGFMNGTLFLCERGANPGQQDICRLDAGEVEVNPNLFARLLVFYHKIQTYVQK